MRSWAGHGGYYDEMCLAGVSENDSLSAQLDVYVLLKLTSYIYHPHKKILEEKFKRIRPLEKSHPPRLIRNLPRFGTLKLTKLLFGKRR